MPHLSLTLAFICAIFLSSLGKKLGATFAAVLIARLTTTFIPHKRVCAALGAKIQFALPVWHIAATVSAGFRHIIGLHLLEAWISRSAGDMAPTALTSGNVPQGYVPPFTLTASKIELIALAFCSNAPDRLKRRLRRREVLFDILRLEWANVHPYHICVKLHQSSHRNDLRGIP